MKNLISISLIISILCASCRENINESVTVIDTPEPKVFVKSSLRGIVIDENEAPISFGNVQIEDNLITTDAQGKFSFENVTVEKSGNLVKANANGFFAGSANSTFSAEGSSYAQITMLSKSNPVGMNASDGATLADDDSNMTISIPSNALRNSDGSPYPGMADVYSKYIDPSDADLGTKMPGELTTITDGQLEAIKTFGMMTFGIDQANGEALEIDPDLAVEIEIPIPEALLDDAPEEIPLWYFDLEEEQWLLAGICTLNGNTYTCVCTSGTGYYCTGVATEAICLSGTILNTNGTPAFYMKVLVENLTDNFVYWGYTDIDGNFCGSVPGGVELQISLIDHCSSTIYTATIGPFDNETTIPDIQVDENIETFVINIKGQINECLIEPLTFGHVAISRPGKITIRPFDSGEMDIDLALNCADFPELQIRVYSDIQYETMSELFIHDEYTDLDVGEIFMCTEIDDFFSITIGGLEMITMPTQWYWEENATTDHIMLEGLGRPGEFILQVLNYEGVGTYNNDVLFNLQADDNMQQPFQVFQSGNGNINVVITSDDGTYIEGTFEGTVFDELNNEQIISSEFRIKKRP